MLAPPMGATSARRTAARRCDLRCCHSFRVSVGLIWRSNGLAFKSLDRWRSMTSAIVSSKSIGLTSVVGETFARLAERTFPVQLTLLSVDFPARTSVKRVDEQASRRTPEAVYGSNSVELLASF